MYNRVDTTISPADLQEIHDALAVIHSKMGFVTGLTPKERTGGWIRSPKALEFMKRVLREGKEQPANFPAIDMAAFERDLTLITQIQNLESRIADIALQLKDTRIWLSKETSAQAFVVYNFMQIMHRNGIKGAEGVNELKELLPRTGKGRPKEELP
jgi:hypothetical protein